VEHLIIEVVIWDCLRKAYDRAYLHDNESHIENIVQNSRGGLQLVEKNKISKRLEQTKMGKLEV
jgi:hypothetical protein